jgi:hypothetical protein
MTEAEWLACNDPFEMFSCLSGWPWRKRQLYGLAAWSRVCDLWQKDESSRNAFAFLEKNAERFNWLDIEHEGHAEADFAFIDIDGKLTKRFWNRIVAGGDELRDEVLAGTEARLTDWDDPNCLRAGAAFTVVAEALFGGYVLSLSEVQPLVTASRLAARINANAPNAGIAASQVWQKEMQGYADLVREVFAYPDRLATFDPAWRTPLVSELAGSAYEQRLLPQGHLDPALLTVLSDAMLDAGCTDAELIKHLREPGPHVRGCWVVDCLTNRE